MAADLSGSPTQAAPDEPHYHNDVLTRTHEPGRAHSSPWMVIVPVALALIVGAGTWAYIQTHPSAPVENHAGAPPPSANG